MTVSTEISSNEYIGNGVTTDFDYKFRIFKANQLSVITSDADGGNVVTLRLGTDYTVTGANKSAGGKVILTRPLADKHKISIARDIPITQETSFRNQSKFFAEAHEDAFDYLTMLMQRLWGNLGLFLKRPNILANWFDAKGYRIANLGKPKRDSDAVDFGTLKDEINSVNGTILKREKRVLRVDDMDIATLPKASERAGNVLTFDKDGNPIVVAPASGSAVDVLNQLRKTSGASLVGYSHMLNYPDSTVGSAIKSIRVNISSFGLSENMADEKSNATLLNQKLQELYDEGVVTEIYMDKSYPVDPEYSYTNYLYGRRVVHLTDFKFYGPAKFTSSTQYNGLYNVHIEDKLCSEPILTNTSNIKISKFKKKDIKVVIMGDSISLDWADSLALGVCQWSIIKAELQAQNPEHTFTFINRAIGGQTWANANTKPTSFRSPWYTDPARNWTDYIIDTDADIVLFAFGMNDRDSFNAGTMISTINKVRTGLPHAHFVLCTCLVPSRGSTYNNGSSFDGLRFQEGRNFAAGFERTYGRWAGFSVFDFNRYFVQARDGKDQVACELQEIPNQEPVNGAYTADACVDFAFEALISGWDKAKVIYINSGGDQSEDFIYIGVDASNNFVVTGRTEYMGAYFSKTTDIQVPSGDFWLVTTVINNECNIYIGLDPSQEPKDGTNNVYVTSFYMVRHGGTVRPKIGMGGVQSGNISKIRVMLGQPTQRKKVITDREMWGLGNNLADRKIPFGGNGINHPSGQGLAKIITPVMQSQDLKVKFANLELPIVRQPNINPYMDNYPSATVVDGIFYLSGSVFGSGASQGATVLNINRYSEFNKGTKLVQAFGIGTSGGWGARILRIEPNGDVKIEVGDSSQGLLLDGITFNLQ